MIFTSAEKTKQESDVFIDENQKIHPIYPEPYRLASEIWENKIVQKNWREPLKLIKAMGWETIPYDYERL